MAVSVRAIVTPIIDTVKDYYKNSKRTLRNFVVFILVLALERIFEKNVFKCPSSRFVVYGNLFMFGPAVCLFTLTILLNGSLWDVITGCRQAHFSRAWICKRLVRHVLEAFLPPCVWLIMALVQTQYYTCAVLGPMEEAKRKKLLQNNGNMTKEEVEEEIKVEFARARTNSQIIAWCLFDTLVILATAAVCVRRCCFLRTEGSLPYIEEYERLESEAAVKEFKTQIDQKAKEIGKEFVKLLFINETDSDQDTYTKMVRIRDQVAAKYPRATGNLSKPYIHRGPSADPREPSSDNWKLSLLVNGHCNSM